MMSTHENKRPVILFPQPEEANRDKTSGRSPLYAKPSASRQYQRLTPSFQALKRAFNNKDIVIQKSPTNINPEIALVFETIGSVDNFYKAICKINGFKWIFEEHRDEIDPNDDFFRMDDEKNRTNSPLTGKVYCLLSNKAAIEQLLSLWKKHSNGEQEVFKKGFAPFRDVFANLNDIRCWNIQDRIDDTYIMEYWRQNLEIEGDSLSHFEIELFFYSDSNDRQHATNNIRIALEEIDGRIVKECVISDISYHSILAVAPKSSIQNIVTNYSEIKLAHIDDIMFFRPTCQSIFFSESQNIPIPDAEIDRYNIEANVKVAPIVAILDGMPIQNHPCLKNRIIVDDPDSFEDSYESQHRCHGTAMASLVIHGDLEQNNESIKSPVYIRPILKPIANNHSDIVSESVPNDEILLDLIHRAIVRICEGEGDILPFPTIKIINLSICDPVRPYFNHLSPLSKLIDWLSFKYKLLFIISAGNHNASFNIPGTFSDFKNDDIISRSRRVFSAIENNLREYRVLSPSESMNSITVGAIFDDATNVIENSYRIFPVKPGFPSPISSFGFGHNSQIKPDIFYYGGKKFIGENLVNSKCKWMPFENAPPGIKVASPHESLSGGVKYSFGTSDAAAQISHEAVKCYDILTKLFNDETGNSISNDYTIPLIKSMLAHGASWDEYDKDFMSIIKGTNSKVCRWIGNGVPNFDRVKECTKERITLIGYGQLTMDEAHVFRLPIPFEFTKRIKRRLTVTLSYLSPINCTKHRYRSVQIWFDITNSDSLKLSRVSSDWQKVRKGTLQHEVFFGEQGTVWKEQEIIIKVNCREDCGSIKEHFPYGLLVTFETGREIGVDVYSAIKNKIKQKIPSDKVQAKIKEI